MSIELEETSVEATVEADIPMKENLLGMVKRLQEKGYKLDETPAIFYWSYSEEPTVIFQLVIAKEDTTMPEGETLQ